MGGGSKSNTSQTQNSAQSSTDTSNAAKTEAVNSTTSSGPSAFAQPYWDQAYSGAQTAYDLTPKTVDQLYAGPNALQTGSLANIVNYAQGPHPDLAAVQGGIDKINAGYQPLDVSGAVNAAINPYYQKLTEQILPQARSAAITQGAYDSPRTDITNGELIRDNWTNPVADTVAKYALQEQQNQQQYALNAAAPLQSLSQYLTQQQLANLALPGQAGQQQQTWDQAQLDAAAKAPWTGLGEYSSILQALPSTAQTTQGVTGTNVAQTGTSNQTANMQGTGTQTQSQQVGAGDLFKGLLGAAMLFG